MSAVAAIIHILAAEDRESLPQGRARGGVPAEEAVLTAVDSKPTSPSFHGAGKEKKRHIAKLERRVPPESLGSSRVNGEGAAHLGGTPGLTREPLL
jgi:hypothetical protein